jgi:hypothetical protein
MFFIHELQERVKISHLNTCDDYQVLKSVSIKLDWLAVSLYAMEGI